MIMIPSIYVISSMIVEIELESSTTGAVHSYMYVHHQERTSIELLKVSKLREIRISWNRRTK